MFSVIFKIPYFDDVLVTDFEFEFDVYRNSRAKIVLSSPNYDMGDIISVIKTYSVITIVLNGVFEIPMVPGFGRITDEGELEIQFFGFIAGLFKDFGYYTENGNGLVDYTIVREETNEPIGISPVLLANMVTNNTSYNIAYAPSLDEYGRAKTESDNMIFIRGEWLNRAEWIYEIAKNCFFYEYCGEPITLPNGVFMPDFTTDKTEGGKLIDRCNVMCDGTGNIVIGVAGCSYMGNATNGQNKWSKKVMNITEYILDPADTIFNFITFENAVVQGNEVTDKGIKRTYLAKPVHLEMHEVFNANFNKANYQFEGHAKEGWTLKNVVDNADAPALECELGRSGDKNYRMYNLAILNNLICNFEDFNMFEVDVRYTSPTIPPWPNQDADRILLGNMYMRAGLFFGADAQCFEDGDERATEIMPGYFLYLEDKMTLVPNSNNPYYPGTTHELSLKLDAAFNLYDTVNIDGSSNPDPVLYSYDEQVARKNIVYEKNIFQDKPFLSVPHTLSVTVEPEYRGEKIKAFTFVCSVYEKGSPENKVTKTIRIESTVYNKPIFQKGAVGLFSMGHFQNEFTAENESLEFTSKFSFDNFTVHCGSETLYGEFNKPIIMHRDRAINNNTQGTLVAQALLETQNYDKAPKIKINPSLFFEQGLTLGQYVQIDDPYYMAGTYRVIGINITPEDVELCLNHSALKYTDQLDGIQQYMEVLDSF